MGTGMQVLLYNRSQYVCNFSLLMPRPASLKGIKGEVTVSLAPHFSIAHSSYADFVWMLDCLADPCIPHKLNSPCLANVCKRLWETGVASFVVPGPSLLCHFSTSHRQFLSLCWLGSFLSERPCGCVHLPGHSLPCCLQWPFKDKYY